MRTIRLTSGVLSTALAVFVLASTAPAADARSMRGLPNLRLVGWAFGHNCQKELFGSVLAQVGNTGSEASPPFNVRIALDGQILGTLHRTSELKTGEEATLGPTGWRPVSLDQGEHTVALFVDPGRQITETTEADNVGRTVFTCP
jgi:hypothetical protein